MLSFFLDVFVLSVDKNFNEFYNHNNVVICKLVAYNRNYIFQADEGTGKVGRTLESPIAFSEIFDGTPPFYAGSTIFVQEILTIISDIEFGKEHLVDVDMRWFNSKVYYGTYQLSALSELGLEPENEGGQGYLTNQVTVIKRYSSYTIAANPNVPFGIGEKLRIDNCNFEIEEYTLDLGVGEITRSRPINNEAMMVGILTNEKAPLADTEYNQFFTSYGLYYNPGCYVSAVNHRVGIINVVYTDFTPYPDVVCQPVGG